jgi:hypothetical protein
MPKKYTDKRLVRFINKFCVERRHRMVIPANELYIAFDKHFVMPLEEHIHSFGDDIMNEIDNLMDKHTYSFDTRYQKYRRRVRYKPRGSRTLRGQTSIFDFIGDETDEN